MTESSTDQAIYIKEREAATRFGIPRSTLQKWRCRGYGPKYHKGETGRILYPVAEFDAWMKEREVVPGRRS